MKNSEAIFNWLKDLGYSHCFFLAGGNIMHLLDAARTRFECVAVTHEVTAGIAAEYFNQLNAPNQRAFALVTAGPGVTNIVTAVAGSWLESRELLVIAGQVKVADLASGGIRQRGIQELDAVPIVAPVAKVSTQIVEMLSRKEFTKIVRTTWEGRPGPVFIEVPLDVQGAPFDGLAAVDEGCPRADYQVGLPNRRYYLDDSEAAGQRIADLSRAAERPVWLLGGGIRPDAIDQFSEQLEHLGIPVMTTWNGTDRYDSERKNYLGRPNTWGQRGPNMLLNSADLIVAFGTRLGLQQTGFNWQEWGKSARVVQIDIDRTELDKGHPRVDERFCCDAAEALKCAVNQAEGGTWGGWLASAKKFLSDVPSIQEENSASDGFIEVYSFITKLQTITQNNDVIVPCSSGGANSTMMQAFELRRGQRLLSNKGLASMGYGLAGAVGSAIARPGSRVILVEGDGGFSQNLQELATVAVRDLDIKIFLFCNQGYGSIRTTQRNYFGGAYLGCDNETGLGFPTWSLLAAAYGIAYLKLPDDFTLDEEFRSLFDSRAPAIFEVTVDPLQTYWPKVTSQVRDDGGMESNPLHKMSPELDIDVGAWAGRNT